MFVRVVIVRVLFFGFFAKNHIYHYGLPSWLRQ